MPATPTSRITIQELPPDTKPDQLLPLLNNRLRELEQSLKAVVVQESLVNVDAGGKRVVNVGDPRDDLDVVNLRTLKRGAGSRRSEEQQTTTAAAAAPEQHYAIVFTKDGFVSDEEESPWLTIDEHREGYPVSALITSKVEPAGVSLKVQFKVRRKDAIEDEDLLELPLEIEAGSNGPVYSDLGLLITDKLQKGTRIFMLIVQGGDAEKVVGQIVMRRAL